MCGISGIFFTNTNSNYIKLIESILNKQHKRGPDYRKVWNNNSNIILGHNRLAIRDLSESGNQPLENDKGVLCYNGEIYNTDELLKQITDIQPNFKLKGNSDTEVLLNHITTFGLKKSLNIINGIFAFAYYDKNLNKIFLVRDRIGVKPLYYMFIDDSLIFASNLSSLFVSVKKVLNYKLTLNLEAIYHYLLQSGLSEGQTFINNIFKLESASYLEYDLKTVTKNIYWTPNTRNDEIKNLLENSIEINKVSDIPVSILFSGGIDSSIIANYCKGFDGIHLCTDETIYAEKIANSLNINLTKLDNINLTTEDFEQFVRNYVKFSGEPSTACIIPMIVAKEISKKYKVAISGNGGDELFYGYERTPTLEIKNSSMNKLNDTHKIILKNGNFSSCDIDDYQFSHIFRNPQNFHMCGVKNFSYQQFKNKIVNKYRLNDQFNKESNFRWLELQTYVKNDLNPTLDFSSMFYSLEVRVPFLDYRLIERALTMTSKQHLKFKNNKILRKNILLDILSKKLNNNLIDRQKRGFSLPQNLKAQYSKLGKNSIEKLIKRNIIKNVNFKHGLKARDEIYFTNSCYSLNLWFEEFIDTNIVDIEDSENIIFKNNNKYSEIIHVNYYTAYDVNIKLKGNQDKNIDIKIESIGDSKTNWLWEKHFENSLDYFQNINEDNFQIKIPIVNKESGKIKITLTDKSNNNKNTRLINCIITSESNDYQKLYNLSLSNRLLQKNVKHLIPFYRIFSNKNLLTVKSKYSWNDDKALYDFKKSGHRDICLKSDSKIVFLERCKLKPNKYYLCSVTGFSKEKNSDTFLYIYGKNKKIHYNTSSNYNKLNRSLGHLSMIINSNDYSHEIQFGVLQNKKTNKTYENIYISKIFCSEIDVAESKIGYPIICPRKTYDVAVVIAMQDRHFIMEKNVSILNKCGLDICIVVTCSKESDIVWCDKISKIYKNFYYYCTDNNFIGCKWQCAFLYAKTFNPNYVVITGSDDLLLPSFINTLYSEAVKNNYDLCGVRNWNIYDEKKDILYNCKYTSNFGQGELQLGAGRIYSTQFLNKINWNIHEHLRDKNLDDLGYYMCKIHNCKIKTLSIDFGLISYKGNWETMNSIDKIIKAVKKSNTIQIEINNNQLHNTTFKNFLK